jgi:hypothetical protein
VSHEQSETVQLPNGKWVNVYGRETPHAGKVLPGEREYGSVDEAVSAAKLRSHQHGLMYGNKPVPVSPNIPAPQFSPTVPQVGPGSPMYGKPIPRANPVQTNHPDPFAQMSFHELRELRAQMPDAQQFLAPYEHRAYARELMMQDPMKGLGLLGAIPGYQAAKGLGLMASRTGASQPFQQMGQGFLGIGEGLAKYFK